MPLKSFVKINSVNNLSDARYCAGMNVDLLGFNLDTLSSDYLSPEKFNEITSWTSGIQFVGEFGDSSAELINELIADYPVNFIQSNDISVLSKIDSPLPKILVQSIDVLQSDMLFDDINLLIIEGPETLSAEQIDLIKAISNVDLILNCGFNSNNVEEIIAATNAIGIAITAGDEIRPGFKDYDELANIFDVLETDDWS
jgi:phosphoribosylanthranilate isomerase